MTGFGSDEGATGGGAMTGRERILKALALGQTDQVPIFELGFNESRIVKLGKLLL